MAKRVLVVDDDPAQRRILEESIKRLGFEVKCAQVMRQLEKGTARIVFDPDSESTDIEVVRLGDRRKR